MRFIYLFLKGILRWFDIHIDFKFSKLLTSSFLLYPRFWPELPTPNRLNRHNLVLFTIGLKNPRPELLIRRECESNEANKILKILKCEDAICDILEFAIQSDSSIKAIFGDCRVVAISLQHCLYWHFFFIFP